MPHKYEWQARIKSVEREYLAMRQAGDRFLKDSRDDPTILLNDLRRNEIVTASLNLEDTYLLRLFAEFESGLRQYWKSTRQSVPATGVLINALASKHRVAEPIRDESHRIRTHRNRLVHERDEIRGTMSIADARS